MGAELGQQFQAFRTGRRIAGVIQIDQKGVVRLAGHPLAYFSGRLRPIYPVALGAKEKLDRIQNVGLIIGSKYPRRFHMEAWGFFRCLWEGCHSLFS